MLKDFYKRLNTLLIAVNEQRGKKGVGALRQELKELQEKELRFRAYRAQMQMNIMGKVPHARTEEHVENVRKMIRAAAQTKVKRGFFEEIILEVPNYYSAGWMIRGIPKRFWRHPDLAHLRPFWEAVERMDTCAVLPQEERESGKYAVTRELYGYVDGLSLVQVRYWERGRRWDTVRFRYFVTDGQKAVEITGGKKSLIKRAAQVDPAPDSPLRAIRQQLPSEWQALVPDKPVDFQASQIEIWKAWKVYRLMKDGTLLSFYDDTKWKLGKWRRQKAEPDHRGGFYVRTGNPEDVIAQFEHGELVAIPSGRNETWQAVLVEVECAGASVRYGNKIAVSMCRPVRIEQVF